MKYFIPIVLAALLFGCQGADVVEKEVQDGSVRKDMIVPAGVKTDTSRHTEPALQLYIVYAHPTDASEAGFMQLFAGAVDSALIAFKNTIAHAPGLMNHFEVTPANYYNDDRMVSIRYIFSTMHAGADQGMADMLSFNYDKQRNQPITWDDYFNISTKADSNLIVKILDEEFLELRESMSLEDNGWAYYGLGRVDFNIRKDTVCFNFAAYQLGQGPDMMEYRVAKSRLGRLIRPVYR